ncbi:PPOX class F420-dependent oxidoreductase [Mycobacterium avium]|uniref:PPOX class F420-dependent oxidoreductase n=1 Tax=Mycobacterium avium TaxID=1764 RepID=UPI001CC3E11E|nr:PPOX class F420-dependent oxidoreductase [Mycobacterium avium]MBZ4521852.1 PPOX class F420-dependent oxidoreductase [Mycobacterium avium subsp. hominissuis]MBZ4531235.1 PPOX class F420-dependent oxidoreductase [Mycobacterium avium subsp. hominissuis]
MATIPDAHRDLIEKPHIASLSTVDPDGMPQVTALWYLAEGDTIATSLMTSRQKYKNLRAHPKATLFIIDPANPYRTLEVRAKASFEDDHDLGLFERIVRHYGMDPETFPAPRDNRVLLRLTPTHVVAQG